MAEEAQLYSNSGARMKKGDYTVHVFLEEMRGISVKGEDEVNAIVMIKTLRKHAYSRVYPHLGPGAIVYLGEHFFFSKSNMTIEEVETSNLLIEVKDHSIFSRDSLVGLYVLDLTYIHKQKEHCLRHQWIALSNTKTSDYSRVRGYIKIGVSVLHESDEPADLALEHMKLTDSRVLLPPQIVPKTTQLVITLLKAENLPVMDLGGTIDTFIEAHFAGVSVKTSEKKADKTTMTSYWYEELYIPVIEPCVAQNLVLRVFDKDALSKSLVGSFYFDWDDILQNKYSDYFWSNIYGAPPGISNENSEIMNNISNLASHWRGRVLAKITTVKNETKAKLQRVKITDPDIDVYVRDNFEVGEEYELRCRAYSGYAFPDKKGKFGLVVEWSGIQLATREIDSLNGSVDWSEVLKKKVTLIPHLAENQLPDLFVYLVADRCKICYARIKVEEVNNLNNRAIWHRLYPDIAVGKVQNQWEGGFIKLRLYAGKKNNTEISTDCKQNWVKPFPTNVTKSSVLLCHLFQCKNLATSDSMGLADPYVVFNHSGSIVSTSKKAKHNTLNPVISTIDMVPDSAVRH